ncbi:hypothetical protein [Rubellimicrobium roseum]|uniref:Uncharacterized protein n=1 Tax=Rubellimicrobium roseum TaxID=687525 RepID=A0A5C4N317_9RHOB|nr:hypothetical protein [Rubellimicrobium roseum]TNC59044.1 hypothetical protein FHG71_23155 [Rubellimicrobium roseum]
MNTRVAVPLTKEAYDAVSFLAKLKGVSRGRFLADVVEVAVPSFIAIEAAYKAVLAAEGEERAQLLEGMKQAERRLMETLAEAMPESADETASAVDARFPEGGERASADGANPPYTNRGVHNLPDEDRGQ